MGVGQSVAPERSNFVKRWLFNEVDASTQVVKQRGEDVSQEEFNVLLGSNFTGLERYFERRKTK